MQSSPHSVQELITKFNITEQGRGEEILLFAHGFGCDQTTWNKVIPGFKENFRVISFDYLGSGNSKLEDYDHKRYETLDAYAEDLAEICTALKLENIYFIGHSVSGAIGMLASIAHPKMFKKLITIAPSPHYLNEDDYQGGFDYQDVVELIKMMQLNYFDWANYLAPIVIGNEDTPEYSEELKLSFLRHDPKISTTFAKATFFCDLRQELTKVSTEVCILYCIQDIIVPLEVIDYLATHLPNCKTREIEATGHYPQITNPCGVISAIKCSINSST
ncbi:MAG: alpha/beta hydrolase [Thiotrichales bacterium]|nr:alpha/beta hydrolase [Thiotrichales bacterium]